MAAANAAASGLSHNAMPRRPASRGGAGSSASTRCRSATARDKSSGRTRPGRPPDIRALREDREHAATRRGRRGDGHDDERGAGEDHAHAQPLPRFHAPAAAGARDRAGQVHLQPEVARDDGDPSDRRAEREHAKPSDESSGAPRRSSRRRTRPCRRRRTLPGRRRAQPFSSSDPFRVSKWLSSAVNGDTTDGTRLGHVFSPGQTGATRNFERSSDIALDPTSSAPGTVCTGRALLPGRRGKILGHHHGSILCPLSPRRAYPPAVAWPARKPTARRPSPPSRVSVSRALLVAPFEALRPLVTVPGQSLTSVEAALAALGAWLLALLAAAHLPAWRTSLTWPWLLVVAAMFAAALAAPRHRNNALNMVRALTLAFGMHLLAVNGVHSAARLRTILIATVAAGAVVAVLALLEYLGSTRPSGFSPCSGPGLRSRDPRSVRAACFSTRRSRRCSWKSPSRSPSGWQSTPGAGRLS